MRKHLVIKLLISLFLTLSQFVFSQNRDTTIVLGTEKSEISVYCKREVVNGKINNVYMSISVRIKLSQGNIEEGLKLNEKTGHYYVNLHFDENCVLDQITPKQKSNNNSFNSEVELYFNEFIEAFNLFKLYNYYPSSALKCGPTSLRFSYIISV